MIVFAKFGEENAKVQLKIVFGWVKACWCLNDFLLDLVDFHIDRLFDLVSRKAHAKISKYIILEQYFCL